MACEAVLDEAENDLADEEVDAQGYDDSTRGRRRSRSRIIKQELQLVSWDEGKEESPHQSGLKKRKTH